MAERGLLNISIIPPYQVKAPYTRGVTESRKTGHKSDIPRKAGSFGSRLPLLRIDITVVVQKIPRKAGSFGSRKTAPYFAVLQIRLADPLSTFVE